MFGASVALLAVVVVGLLLLTPSFAPVAPSAEFTPAAAIPPWNTWTCNPNNPSPSAISIPTPNIGQARAAGTGIGVSYEFKVVNYTKSDRGTEIDFPTAVAVFPTTVGSFTLTIPPKNVSVASGHWSLPTVLTASRNLTARTAWSASPAYLSTEKFAVMADAASGSITIALRWHWTVTPAGGGTLKNGTWTVPSQNSTPGFLPSIFFPAPLVTLGPPTFHGTTMTFPLAGAAANTSFRLVLEYPTNGTEIQSIWENTSLHATTFNATLPVTYRDGASLPNGTYLTHVHDVCEAIVHMHSVAVTGGLPFGRVELPTAD